MNFHNCDPATGGEPKCRLPLIDNRYNKPWVNTIQLKGASAKEVVEKSRVYPEFDEFDVFLVGEAPGAQEDRLGIPFVGDAGDILSNFLTKSGFDLERVYITNTVKCRPPNNRKPASAEIKACSQHIQYEFRKHKPKVVMLMGNSALGLFRLKGIGKLADIHGKVFERKLPGWEDGPTFTIIPTYHPAAFLHRPNPDLMNRIQSDYVLARKLLEGQDVDSTVYKAKFNLVETVEGVRDMVETLRERGIAAFDTESPSLGFRKNPMIMTQFSIGEGQTWIVPMYRHDPNGVDFKLRPQWTPSERKAVVEAQGNLFSDPHMQWAAHNIKYDMNVVRMWLGVEIEGWLWDTLIMRHLLYEYRPHNLEYLADLEFACGDYGEPVRNIVGHGRKKIKTYDHIPDHIFYQYGATDAEMCWKLFWLDHGKLQLKPHLMKLYAEESHPAIRSLAHSEWAGNYMNIDIVEQIGEDCEKEIEELTEKCRDLTKPDFNPGSPIQVARAFVDLGLGHVIKKEENPSGFSTDKAILAELSDEYPLAEHVLKYRSINKMKTTYVENVLEDIDDDGRLRYSFNIAATTSGRQAAKFFHQIHTIDKEKVDRGEAVMRDMFGEEDGFYYFYADYSQIELRIFAILAGEEELVKLFREGGDVHAATAAAALGIPIDKVSDFNRTKVGKRVNFGIVYGSEGYKLSKGVYDDPENPGHRIPMNLSTVQGFIGNFKRQYPKIDFYLKYIPDLARSQGGMLRSVFGRERRLIGLNDSNEAKRSHAEREAVNFTIQSPAGGVAIRTINMIDDILTKHTLHKDIRMCNNVHDSVSYGVRKPYLDWFSEVFKKVAERPILELENNSFPVNCGWSENTWTEAELNAK